MAQYNFGLHRLEAGDITGRLFVYHPSDRTIVKSPVFFVWGFDTTSAKYTQEQVFSLLNGEDAEIGEPGATMAEQLLACGHDIFVVLPDKTTRRLEENAQLVVKALEYVYGDCRLGLGVPNTVIGLSAGGIIARLALLMIEAGFTSLPEQTTVRYFSYDTPHRGANVPLSIQFLLNWLGAPAAAANYLLPGFSGLWDRLQPTQVGVINSEAARQLATFHYSNQLNPAVTPQPDPLRRELLMQLGDRWPRNVKRYAIANGNGEGRPQAVAPGEMIMTSALPRLTFRALPWHDQECQIYSLGEERPALHWAWVGKGGQPLDSAPGSTGTFYRDVYVNLVGCSTPAPMCFVPTTSALDCSDDVWNGGPNTAQGAAAIHFDEWYCSKNNDQHVKVTREITEFIVSRVGA